MRGLEKGHLIVAAVLFCMMVCLPVLAVTPGDPATGTGAVSQSVPKATDTVEVLRTDTGKVEEYSLQDYLFGVVAAEMPMGYGEEALKAQTVAAYTLFLHRQSQPADDGEGDITDSSSTDQAFITREIARAKWGEQADAYEEQLDGIIGQVMGQYLAFDGKPALTVYHSISGGRTESAENVWGGTYAYLTPVESVGDVMSEGYISQKTVSKGAFVAAVLDLDSTATQQGELDDMIGEISRSDSGTVLNVKLMGKSFTGSQVRTAFSLRSANFDVETDGESVTFTVRGYGHLVGMSQYGAKTMAEQGSTYKEILAWYYPGCQITQDEN